MKTNYTSHEWTQALLESKLDGNAMKIIQAYLQVGGWKTDTPVFLCRKDYENYGLSRATVTRWRVLLIELGWLVPADVKSAAQYDLFYVRMGAVYTKPPRRVRQSEAGGCLNVMQGVPQNEAGGASICGTEVTTEVSNEVTIEETTASPVPGSHSSGKPSSSTYSNLIDKEYSLNGFSPSSLNIPEDAGSPYRELDNRGVPQIEAGQDRVLTAAGATRTRSGELEW